MLTRMNEGNQTAPEFYQLVRINEALRALTTSELPPVHLGNEVFYQDPFAQSVLLKFRLKNSLARPTHSLSTFSIFHVPMGNGFDKSLPHYNTSRFPFRPPVLLSSQSFQQFPRRPSSFHELSPRGLPSSCCIQAPRSLLGFCYRNAPLTDTKLGSLSKLLQNV